MGNPIVDQVNGYGSVGVRELPGNLARTNADSYAYFAMVGFQRKKKKKKQAVGLIIQRELSSTW